MSTCRFSRCLILRERRSKPIEILRPRQPRASGTGDDAPDFLDARSGRDDTDGADTPNAYDGRSEDPENIDPEPVAAAS